MKRRFVEASPTKRARNFVDMERSHGPPAMNPAKLREISSQLAPSPERPRLLVISGPSGCCKSAAVHYLSKELGVEIKEFHEPDSEHLEAFGDFLLGCSLLGRDKLVLVDDLPNLSHQDTLLKFQQSLRWWIGLDSAPLLVVVFTEVELEHYGESYLVGRVFDMINEPNVKHIKCLPISPRYLTAALKQHTDDKQLINALAQVGDIRQALRGLDYGAQRDTKNSVFHRVGQVVWGSKNVDPLDLIDSGLDAHVFENYTKRELPVDVLVQCSEALSAADALGTPLGCYIVHGVLSKLSSGKKMIPMTLFKRRMPDTGECFGEWAFVRDRAVASIKDIALDRSFGLENKRPLPEFDFSSSDDD